MNFDRRITPFRPDLADTRLKGQVEAGRFSTGNLRRVTAPSTTVHRHPSSDAGFDTEALMGELVTIYEERDGWAWGQLKSDGYVGYLQAASLDDPGTEPTHKIGVMRTFLYTNPSFKLPNAGFLSLGARVAVTEIVGDYARLATGGYVFAAHLVALDTKQTDFVAVAESLLGAPFLWGGKTTLGLDCSGLVQTALRAVGIEAPRDSDMQEKELGTFLELKLDLSGLKRGDLVFWKGHVGIMADATRLLHATAYSMTVMIEPLAVAEERIRTNGYGPITSVKRLR